MVVIEAKDGEVGRGVESNLFKQLFVTVDEFPPSLLRNSTEPFFQSGKEEVNEGAPSFPTSKNRFIFVDCSNVVLGARNNPVNPKEPFNVGIDVPGLCRVLKESQSGEVKAAVVVGSHSHGEPGLKWDFWRSCGFDVNYFFEYFFFKKNLF